MTVVIIVEKYQFYSHLICIEFTACDKINFIFIYLFLIYLFAYLLINLFIYLFSDSDVVLFMLLSVLLRSELV